MTHDEAMSADNQRVHILKAFSEAFGSYPVFVTFTDDERILVAMNGLPLWEMIIDSDDDGRYRFHQIAREDKAPAIEFSFDYPAGDE